MAFMVAASRHRRDEEPWDPYEEFAARPCAGCGATPAFMVRGKSLLASSRAYATCQTCLDRVLADPAHKLWFGDKNTAYEYESLTERVKIAIV